MTARRGLCRWCDRYIAVSGSGRLWTHGGGGDACPGSRTRPALFGERPEHYWPTRYRGRRVVTIPGPDTYNPKENAA